MSVRVMADVWDGGPEDPVDCSVLLALANHCDDYGRSCFPSEPTIARMARRVLKTVQRSIQALEAAGWIEVERGEGRGNFSSYTINVERLEKQATAARREREIAQGKRRQRVAIFPGEKGRLSRPQKATLCPQKATSTVPYKEEPSWNHQGNKNTPPPPSPSDGGVELPGMSREEFLRDLEETNELRARMVPAKRPFSEAEWAKIVAESHRQAAAKAAAGAEASQWEPRRTKAGRLRWRRRGG